MPKSIVSHQIHGGGKFCRIAHHPRITRNIPSSMPDISRSIFKILLQFLMSLVMVIVLSDAVGSLV